MNFRRIVNLLLALYLTTISSALYAEPRVIDEGLHHLRLTQEKEWDRFPSKPDYNVYINKFDLKNAAQYQTLQLRQVDVRQAWTISLNNTVIRELRRDENDMTTYIPIPPDILVNGTNVLTIKQQNTEPDDIQLGRIALIAAERSHHLSQGSVHVQVKEDGDLVPCRITIVNEHGSLQEVGATSNDNMAVREGVVYTGNGSVDFGLPEGTFTVFAGKGFEYSVDSAVVKITPGISTRVKLNIVREVPTDGYISADLHTHTYTYGGHGDATIQEQMLVLAGEGIEMPVSTEHNQHIDYDPVAREMGVREYFTPVIGNEVTTSKGHFNVFPLRRASSLPNYRLENWDLLFESIYSVGPARVVMLNHSLDIHSGFTPFSRQHLIRETGEILHPWKFRANTLEVINSGAQQTDQLDYFRIWMGLLSRGYDVIPAGTSDSHSVSRYFAGQTRTYIRYPCDTHAGDIDTDLAIDNFLRGNVMVSLGLATQLKVNGKEPGSLVRSDDSYEAELTVLGPSWATADSVYIFANGVLIRTLEISDRNNPGIKLSGDILLEQLKHDTFINAIAVGPAVKKLYWPIGQPYQPRSKKLNERVVGASGAVFIDVDEDNRFSPAFEYANRVVQANRTLPEVLKALSGYDMAVSMQAASVLRAEGENLWSRKNRQIMQKAAPHVRIGFERYGKGVQLSEK